MKFLFKLFSAVHIWIYRRSGGRIWGNMSGIKVLLLTTTGRKSGKTHTTPLGGFDHKDGFVVVASNGGQPKNPAWYLNLRGNSRVTLQVLDKVMHANAELLIGEAREDAWQGVIAAAPAYARYGKMTEREIPLVLLRLELPE